MKGNSREKMLIETTPILESIARLALPTIMGQIILVIYNKADTFFVGLTNSDEMVTAVTICMPAFMFLSAVSNLFGVGGSSVISRSLGQRNHRRASGAAAFSFWGCFVVAILYSLGAFVFGDAFINVLGGKYNPNVHRMSVNYLMITVVGGGIFTAMSTFLAHLIRSEGRSVHASIGIALGGILNIGLDPLFMFVILPKGHAVEGAAIATALSNTIALIYFVLVLRRNRRESVLRFKPSNEIFTENIPTDVLSTGLPACLMTLFENISYAILDNLMAANGAALAAGIGVAMQAGIGVAKKVNMLAHCIVRGMSQGVLPLIGYNYASGNHKRMKQAIVYSMLISVSLATLCMIANLTLSKQLISIFLHDSPDSIGYGARFLRILTIGAPFSACAYAFISFFQAVGNGFKSFILAILRKGVLDIPLMFLLNALFPIYGIVWATPIADTVCCIVSIVLFIGFLQKQTNLSQELAAELD